MVLHRAVTNAGPLIYLALLGRFSQLRLLINDTIGILLYAKEMGIEIDLNRDLDLLIQHNFRISSDLYQKFITEQQE